MDQHTRKLLERYRGREINVLWVLGDVPQTTRGTLEEFDDVWLHIVQPQKGSAEPGQWWIRVDTVGAVTEGVVEREIRGL
jgi:hypothetical protein